jgi:hypothetical protein
MGKRLLTKDYKEIVMESFKISVKDQYKYYSNIIEFHSRSNPDIFRELESEIKNWITKYDILVSEAFIHFPRLTSQLSNPDEISVPFNEFGQSFHVKKSFFENLLNIIKDLEPKAKMTAPVISLFCELVSDCKILQQYYKTNENHCKDVCIKYKLEYSDRVRQNFRASYTPKNLQKVKELILPLINERDRKKIIEYINNSTDIYG